MTLRILHCIPTMDGGGSQRQLTYLVKEQARQGLDVHVAIGRGGPNLARLQDSGASVHLLPPRPNQDPRRTPDLIALMRRVRPDLVQTWLLQMDFFGGLAARISRLPWILAERSSVGTFHPATKYFLRRLVARSVTAIVSNSRGGDAYWRRQGLKGSRWIIPNGIPVEEIEEAKPAIPSQAGFSPARRTILSVGRINPTKNLIRLIEAIEIVSAQHPVQALICGTGLGSYTHACLDLIRRRKLEGIVTLVGYRPDVWSWMKKADLLVSISLAEGHPNAVLEGMAARSPLVLSDIPAHREFVDEQSAVFVDPLSVEDIAGGIARCLEDREGAHRRAEAARKRALDISIPEMARRYLDVYHEVLEKALDPDSRAKKRITDSPGPLIG